MHDLTKLDLSPGPWELDGSFVADAINLPIVTLAYCSNDDARVLAASYEMLEALIVEAITQEDEDGVANSMILRVIKKATGLTWAEVKQRLGV